LEVQASVGFFERDEISRGSIDPRIAHLLFGHRVFGQLGRPA